MVLAILLFAELLILSIVRSDFITLVLVISQLMLVFSPSFRPLFLKRVLYVTHSIRIGGATDLGVSSLDSSTKDRHVG